MPQMVVAKEKRDSCVSVAFSDAGNWTPPPSIMYSVSCVCMLQLHLFRTGHRRQSKNVFVSVSGHGQSDGHHDKLILLKAGPIPRLDTTIIEVRPRGCSEQGFLLVSIMIPPPRQVRGQRRSNKPLESLTVGGIFFC